MDSMKTVWEILSIILFRYFSNGIRVNGSGLNKIRRKFKKFFFNSLNLQNILYTLLKILKKRSVNSWSDKKCLECRIKKKVRKDIDYETLIKMIY